MLDAVAKNKVQVAHKVCWCILLRGGICQSDAHADAMTRWMCHLPSYGWAISGDGMVWRHVGNAVKDGTSWERFHGAAGHVSSRSTLNASPSAL